MEAAASSASEAALGDELEVLGIGSFERMPVIFESRGAVSSASPQQSFRDIAQMTTTFSLEPKLEPKLFRPQTTTNNTNQHHTATG